MRRGFRGGKLPGTGENRFDASKLGAGEGGDDEIADGWRCGGSRFSRMSTLISSVCTDLDLVGMGSRI